MIIDFCAAPAGADILSGQGCDYGGLEALFYGFYSDIDWSLSTYSGNQITALVMNTGKVLYEIGFDPETGQYTNSLQNEAFYKNDVVVDIIGKSKDNMVQIQKLRAACGDLVIIPVGRDCSTRVYGVTRNRADDAFQKTYRPVKVSTHDDTSGQPSSKSMDTVTFTNYSTHNPLFASLGVSDLVALL